LKKALPPGQTYFKPKVSIESLDRIANPLSDNQSVQAKQDAKRKLFLGFQPKQIRGAKPLEPKSALHRAPWKCRTAHATTFVLIQNQRKESQQPPAVASVLQVRSWLEYAFRNYRLLTRAVQHQRF
jgi:hypothetical protein